jgi:transposase
MEIDRRTLESMSLETIRTMAVQRVRDGEQPTAVSRSFGLCRTTIYRWLRAVQTGGQEALRSRKATGRPPRISAGQKQQVGRWLNGQHPPQYGFHSPLWTRRIVAELVQKRLQTRLSITAVGRLLYDLGIPPQKPLRRASERDPIAVERWKREEYPALRTRAIHLGAEIFFADEAGIRSDAAAARTWAPRGKTPVLGTTGTGQAVHTISAVTARGAFWYRTYRGRLTARTFIAFLRAFLRDRRTPVMLVLDRHPAHIAKAVVQFVQSTRGRLELHFLPG